MITNQHPWLQKIDMLNHPENYKGTNEDKSSYKKNSEQHSNSGPKKNKTAYSIRKDC